MDIIAFGQRLKGLRGERSQAEIVAIIASKTGVPITAQTLGRYERGERKPDIEIIEALANTFEVSADYLLCRTDIKSTDNTEINVCDYTGLSEQAIHRIIYFTKDDWGKGFCKRSLHYIFETLEIGLLHDIDKFSFLKIKKNIFQNVVLKKYLNEKYPNIPDKEIHERGIFIFHREIGKKWFGKNYECYEVERNFNDYLEEMRKKYKLIDSDLTLDFEYEKYKMNNSLSRFIDDLSFEYLGEEQKYDEIEKYYSTAINGEMSEQEQRMYFLENWGITFPTDEEDLKSLADNKK